METTCIGTHSTSVPKYNILLIGESGAGKSLLVNCVPNYLKYKTMDEVLKGGSAMCLIPIRFTLAEEDCAEKVYEFGKEDSNNERLLEAESSTKACLCYELNCGDVKIRLIDSPGIGLTRGTEEDAKIMENMLETIGRYDHLHAIAIVMHSDQTKMSPSFKACMKMILTPFHRSAAANLVFILTHSEGSDYSPSKFLPTFKLFLNEIKGSKTRIQLEKSNVYCVDNKGYRYLFTRLSEASANEDPDRLCVNAWAKSANEVHRLLHYVIHGSSTHRLDPHRVKDSISINEAKQFQRIVAPLLPDITSKFKDKPEKLEGLTNTQKILNVYNNQTKADDDKLDHVWICQSNKCKKEITLNGVTQFIYSQVCCEASTWRWFITGQCNVCYCNVSEHRKIKRAIANREAASYKRVNDDDMKQLNNELELLKDEIKFIESAEIKLKKFNAANSIICNDGDPSSDDHSIDLDEASTISEIKNQLFNSKELGIKIKFAYDMDVANRRSARYNNTKVVKGIFKLNESTTGN